MQRKMKASALLEVVWIYVSILLETLSSFGVAGPPWYRGCYFLPDLRVPTKVSEQPHYQLSRDWTPVRCARRCLENRFSFAYLHNGNACFCRQYLTRKTTYDNTCNQRCPGDRRFKCGGSKTANVYSVFGPYISSVVVEVEPKRVIKFQDIAVTVSVALASDASTRTGIRQFDRSSFTQAEVNLRLDPGLKTKATKKIAWIRGRKGQVRFKLSGDTKGLKIIDVTVKNAISTLKDRNSVHVGSQKPTGLTLWFARLSLQYGCRPETEEIFQGQESVVFVAERVVFRAEVRSGFNLTFNWTLCGEIRSYVAYLENPDCAFSACRQNGQTFTFRHPGPCDIVLRVLNKYGFEESTLRMKVLTPEFRDLTVSALSSNLNRMAKALADSPMPQTWGLPGVPIHEGIPPGRGRSQSEDYPSGLPSTHFLFGITPSTETRDEEEEDVDDDDDDEDEGIKNHIPLEEGQYLKESHVKFQAKVFLNNLDEDAHVEIDFGDGNGIKENIGRYPYIPTFGMRRRRSLSGFADETDSVAVGTRKKRRSEEYSILEDPQDSDLHPTPSWLSNGNPEFGPRRGGFTLDQMEIQDDGKNYLNVSQDQNCILHVDFEHVYQEAGEYNATVRIFDGTNSLFATARPIVHILNGTSELNIRCPDFVGLGESVIVRASSVTELPDTLTWKIFSRTENDVEWTQEEEVEKSGISLKKTFLWRGFYQIDVTDGQLLSTCFIQIEEPLSELHLTSKGRYVQTGTSAELEVNLGSGTIAELQLYSDGTLVETALLTNSKRRWFPKFSVQDATCHRLFVHGKNPVSNLTSGTVEICGEHEITGLSIAMPSLVDLNEKTIATIGIARGSNVSLEVQVFSLFGRKLSVIRRRILLAKAKQVKVTLPTLSEPGRYQVMVKAKNNVYASSPTCDSVDILVAEKTIYAAKLIPGRHRLSLSRRKISIEDSKHVYVYKAELDGRVKDEEEILYSWMIRRRIQPSPILLTTVSYHYSSSPLFAVTKETCEPFSTVNEDLKLTIADGQPDEKCTVQVQTLSPTNNGTAALDSLSAEEERGSIFFVPLKHIAETKEPLKFQLKSASESSDSYIVSFGDGNESVKIPPASVGVTFSHTFNQSGLYNVTIRPSSEEEVVEISNIVIQEKITTIKLEGSTRISYELNPFGSWRATVEQGSHKVYRWSVIHVNGSSLVDQFAKNPEWGFQFPDVGHYIVRVVVFNDVSREILKKDVEVQRAPWFFSVKANSSVLGKPSSFIVSTNASSNIIAVKFENSSRIEEFDLSCLRPNVTTLNEENKIINSYVITHTYNQSGSYEATFSLLSRSDNDRTKRLYTLKTEVLHKPEAKKLHLSISKGKAVEGEGKYYVATTKETVIRASTNFYTKIFTWKVLKIQGYREDVEFAFPDSANSSTSFLKHTFSHPGRYKILVTSYPEEIESMMFVEAEDLISKVWVDQPYSSKFVNYCRLQKREVNGSVEYRCESLTLTGYAYGTIQMFYFEIRYRPEIDGNYSAPTELVDVIKAPPKRKIHGTGSEASVEYYFSRQGVFSITVVGSNHLGNMSAEVPPEKPLDGSIRPFLLHAQRALPRMRLEKHYFVPLHEESTFHILMGNSKQVMRIEWKMGDGKTLIGRSVNHTYHEPGLKELQVTASNYVSKKRIKAQVRVEIRIKEVSVQEMAMAYSTTARVELRAIVRPPNSAWNYKWFLGHNRTENVSYASNIWHLFPESGMYSVKVIASNKVSSLESLPIEVEVQEPIWAVFDGQKVVRINDEVNMSVNLMSGSNVSVTWTINDEVVNEENLTISQSFQNVGVNDIRIDLVNKLGEFHVEEKIFVMDNPCQYPEVNITNKSLKPFLVTRSKPLRLEVAVHLMCPFVAQVKYDWKVQEVIFYGYYDYQGVPGEEINLGNMDTNKRILEIPPETLPYGNYSVTVNVSVEGTILYKEADARVNVYPSPLVAKIGGGNVRQVNRTSFINIDASSSYNPDYPENRIEFDWECFVLHSPFTSCFRDDLVEITTPDPPLVSSSSSMRAADEYISDNVLGDQIYKDFPPQIHTNSSILNFPASWLITTANAFVFKVGVSTSHDYSRYAHATVVLKLQDERSENVRIICNNCRDGKVPKHISLQFEAKCQTCATTGGKILYKWSMHEVDDGKESFYKNETSDCAPRDGRGWMSLFGFPGNGTDLSDDSQTNPFLVNLSSDANDGSDHEDPNFYGNTVPEHVLNQPWQDQDAKNPHQSMSGMQERPRTRRAPLAPNGPYQGSEYSSHQTPEITPGNEPPPGGSNMREGYPGGHQPLGPSPSEGLEEAIGGSRFSSGDWTTGPLQQQGFGDDQGGGWGGYNDGMDTSAQSRDTSPYYSDTQQSVDRFRTNDGSSNVPASNHYQDLKHITLKLDEMSLGDLNRKVLILRPNVLSEGKTYSVTVEIYDNEMSEKFGKTSYYFSILRGPSYGDCSVLYRKKNYQIHCAGWKNQQNDNKNDYVSRREILHFDMSYSLERDDPRRQIYSGVSNEKTFNLPRGDRPAYIHIVLRNTEGAATNVCSFLPAGPNSTNQTEADFLLEAFEKSVPENSVLNQMVALRNQEEIIALSNIILDTIPAEDYFTSNESVKGSRLEQGREIVFHVVRALTAIQPTTLNAVRHIIETLTRALSRGRLVSVNAFFEAGHLLIDCMNFLEDIRSFAEDSCADNYISDEGLLKMLIAVRLRLTNSRAACAARIQLYPNSREIEEVMIVMDKNNTFNDAIKVSIKNKLTELEQKIYFRLNKFFLGVARNRPDVLGPLRAVVGGYAVVIQQQSNVLKLFSDETQGTGNIGRWKVGAVFPKTVNDMLSPSENVSEYYISASNLPDVSLTNFEQQSIEERYLAITVYNNDSSEIRLRRLNEPIVVALPPRKLEMVTTVTGIVSRNRVTSNAFPVHKLPNTTLHLEIELEATDQRSFPVSIAITRRGSDHSVPPQNDDILKKRVVSRGNFREFLKPNGSVIVKMTLRDADFLYNQGLFYVVLWNEQSMTSRSRQFDTPTISYSLRIWWSDCFYWDEFFEEWRKDGVQVSDQSTSTQTLCKTRHLSSFSASFVPVRADFEDSGIGIPIAYTALRGSLPILLSVVVMCFVVLQVHHRLLRTRELHTPTSVFRTEGYGAKFSEIGRRLRWFFGPDHKPNAVPIILHDNRKSHKQVFEVTFQTCCWPGSGTTSNVYIILYGEDGKYDARELITPKTHNAREARYENGYSENDDHTGVDDELFITGSTQKFVISYPEDLGPLWKIVIWHDDSGEWPSWKLDYVTIRDITKRKKWHFPYYGWFALDRGKNSSSAELRPVLSTPSFDMQIGLKLNAFLCNFSSIGSLLASPGYGKLSRSQRVVHVFALFSTICGLTTARYMLEWDIYSHDSDLPYIHGFSILWGLIIGIAASIIVLPAHLLFRFSKHDDRISVMMEDVTKSRRGSDFPADFGSHRYPSSLNIIKRQIEEEQRFNKDVEFERYQGIQDCHLPSVEDAVCDWLELKAQSERKSLDSPPRSYVDKDIQFPEARSIVSPTSRQSINSLDEEIVRCMMTVLSKSSQSVKETELLPRKNQGFGNDAETNNRLAMPPQGHNAIFTHSPRTQCEVNCMLQSGSLLTEQYEGNECIYGSLESTLAMEAPEIVPCEKLEPLPNDFLLPRGCQKFAWVYYVFFSIGAFALTLYGSVAVIRSYDVGPWLECIVFSMIGVVLFIEGTLIVLFAVLTSIYDTLKWAINREDLWVLLDRIFSCTDVSTITECTTDLYIDSSTYYPATSLDSSSSNIDENLLEDARIARKLAERERLRYLRHVEPPEKAPSAVIQEAKKSRRMKKAAADWGSVIFLLILGTVSAAIISNNFEKVNAQTRDVEEWLSLTTAFPAADEYLTTRVYESRNKSSKAFKNVRTKTDWMNWYVSVIMQKQGEAISAQGGMLSDCLIGDHNKSNVLRSHPEREVRYIVLGTPAIYLKYHGETTDFSNAPQKISSLMKLSINQDGDRRDELESHDAPASFTKPQSPVCLEGNEKDRVLLENIMMNNRSLFSAEVAFILHNPYSNLYSDVSAETRFSTSPHSKSRRARVVVNSVALSQPGVDRTWPDAAYQSFYLCQILFVLWATCLTFRGIVMWANWALQKLSHLALVSDAKTSNSYRKRWTTPLDSFLEFTIWLLVLLALIFSADKRSTIERLMPNIYAYGDTSIKHTDVAFRHIIQSSARLSTTYGLLNFLLVLKVLTISRKYHNFPRVPAFGESAKSTIGEIVMMLVIFWIAVCVFAGVGYYLFSDELPFSSFVISLMSVVLSSLSFGNFPAHSSADFRALRAKYGTIITLFFFLAIFVSLRLLLKAFFIAALRKRAKTKRKSKKKRKSNSAISLKDFVLYLWGRIRYIVLCIACVILRRDPGLWNARNEADFSSLGFSKAKTLTSRNNKKLRHVPSNRSQRSTSAKGKVEEIKSDEEKKVHTPNKYNLPTEVWLTEVESQLDELFSRASALVDLAHQETSEEGQRNKDPIAQGVTQCRGAEGAGQSSANVYLGLRDNKVKDAGVWKTAASDEATENTPVSRVSKDKLPTRRKSQEDAKILRKIHPREEKSACCKERKTMSSQGERDDSGISTMSRNSSPRVVSYERSTRSPMEERRERAPAGRKIQARWDQAEHIEYVQAVSKGMRSSPNNDHRRHGWISDDDIVDRSSDVSAISSSSFGTSETPVPPLTQHNLARHNYHIFSRQTSTTAGAANSSGQTVGLPGESATSHEAPPDQKTLKILRHFSSFKKYVKTSKKPQTVEVKARPLRRSRTNAINIKDLPSISTHYDSDASSDKTGKKSSASTTKMRSILSIPKLGFGGTKVERIGPGSRGAGMYCASSQSELRAKQRPVNQASAKEDIEVFSIPGTVLSSRSSPSQVKRITDKTKWGSGGLTLGPQDKLDRRSVRIKEEDEGVDNGAYVE